MKVFVLDDDITVCHSLKVIVSALGHDVDGFVDPLHAVDAVTPELEFVISDVNMPAMDGFGFAREIVDKLGQSPPRVLLVSGARQARMHSTSPSRVMGIVYKPFSISQLTRIVSLVQDTRSRCPGCTFPFLSCRKSLSRTEPGGAFRGIPHLCHSGQYALCPRYETIVGPALREWIGDGAESRQRLNDWSKAPTMRM